MTGHATPEEQQIVDRLECTLDIENAPVADLLELGTLYIEPCHREADAIALFEGVLKRDPKSVDARFWLAYCCVHYLMSEEALRRAASLLESIIAEQPAGAGHAYMLLAVVLADRGVLSMERKIGLLEASVSCEPNWVYNRQSLAWAYRDEGRFADALAQIYRALENVRTPDPNWGFAARLFEEVISGRTADTSRILSDLAKIEKDQSKT